MNMNLDYFISIVMVNYWFGVVILWKQV